MHRNKALQYGSLRANFIDFFDLDSEINAIVGAVKVLHVEGSIFSVKYGSIFSVKYGGGVINKIQGPVLPIMSQFSSKYHT